MGSVLFADEQVASPLQVTSDTPELLYAEEGEVLEVGVLESEGEISGEAVGGVSSLIENAENGSSGISDNTSSPYSLFQSSVVSQGSLAFHLAGIWDDYFSLTTDLLPTIDTKLYFESQLSWATSDQEAKVQVSTDGGSTWPTTIYTQSGTGPGEVGFTLQEVSLSAFAGTNIRIRFLYQFDFGSYYGSTDPGVGWHIDNIQVGDEFQKELYAGFGDPSDDEQHYLEFINRARAAASVEAARLRDETDSLVTSAYSNWGLDTNDIVSQFSWHVSNGCMDEVAQPLAFNVKLLQMARLHTQDMFANDFQSHTSSSSPPSPLIPGGSLGDRIDAVAYTGYTNAGENIYSYAKSVAHGHAGFDVDWGNSSNSSSGCYNSSFSGQAMQNPPGHRLTIHNDTFSEIGIGVVNGSNGGVGPQLVTQNFGNSGGVRVTGVVYDDLNENGFYEPGEGIGGVRVEIDESPNYAETSSSGGYALPVPGDGAYTVEFSGDGIPASSSEVSVTGSKNVKVDYIVPALTGYALWASNNGVVGGIDDDDDDDEVANGIEYGLTGFSMETGDSSPMAAMTIGPGGDHVLTLTKNPEASDLTYVVKTSTDGVTWTASHVTVVEDTASVLSVAVSGAEEFLLMRLEIGFSD